VADESMGVPPPPPNEPLVRALLDSRRYEDALKELRYAQRVWGDSPSIQATMSWIQRRQGQEQAGPEQFNLLRGSISTMRRAYPQFMAAGGEDLPKDVLTHIFPLAYWDLIQSYSAQHELDRFLVAALVAQESTFVPAVRSSAGAVGLMQLMPATARAYARRLKLTYSSRLLTNPDANLRMGTAYLADKIREFGAVHLALASYNAGERAVREWQTERRGLPRDEFIDDIPYPETQNYVKRILGTAEDYRRLYGS
jgi:soluble lytic murein transglycosylase